MKVKILLPGTDFKKVNFSKLYGCLNEAETHEVILNFLISQIIVDEKAMAHHWPVIDLGFSTICK
jgi:hypothetical protein